MTDKSDITRLLKVAHALAEVTGVTNPIEIREAVEQWGVGCPEDVSLTIDGEDWRFIRVDKIDEILADELSADTYVLGCFNACFLAGVTSFPVEMIEACQKAEAFDAVGQAIIDCGFLEDVASAYASADGYGHHFASYDFAEHEFRLTAFSGVNENYRAFRVG